MFVITEFVITEFDYTQFIAIATKTEPNQNEINFGWENNYYDSKHSNLLKISKTSFIVRWFFYVYKVWLALQNFSACQKNLKYEIV